VGLALITNREPRPMPSNHRALSAAMQPSLSIAAAEHMNIVSQQERVADSLCSQPVSRSAGNAALIRFGRNPKWLKPVWEGLGKVCPLYTRKREKGIEIIYTLLFLSRFPLPTRIRLSGCSSATISDVVAGISDNEPSTPGHDA